MSFHRNSRPVQRSYSVCNAILHRGIYPPRRVFAVVAGGEEADVIAVGVVEIRLAPEPGAIGGRFGEFEAESGEASVFGIDVGAVEIEDDVVGRYTLYRSYFCLIYRQSRFAVRTLKPSVSRQGIDDPSKTELLKKLDGLDGALAVNRDLIEIHNGVRTLLSA